MDAGEPSRTAKLAAASRAAHLLHHGPRALVQDWLAWPLLGAEADDMLALGTALLGDGLRTFATWFGARARLADDWLAASGCREHVVLGAGLDSSAWRNPDGPRVYEVDHPATQQWKRARVETLGLGGGSTWVPVDFERQDLAVALSDAGLADERPFVTWHGVIPYLTSDAIEATLAALPSCTLSVSYVLPESEWDDEAVGIGTIVQAVAADSGEPWVSLVTPEQITELLAKVGYTVEEDVGARDIEPRYGLAAVNYERVVLARR